MNAVWHGRDWEEYCISLLQKRYAAKNAHTLQLVPARHQGDLGLEAFSHDGYGYQCYAAEEPLSTADLYEKQRTKLTTDLTKLRDRSDEVSALLGPVILHRYVFLVHRHDSRHLISHGHTKAADVVSWNLPFIDDSFSIVIETADDYANERREIHAIPSPIIQQVDLSTDERDLWEASNQTLQQTALNKLARISSSKETQNLVLDALINQYLRGENALNKLRTIAPEVHRGILSARGHREALLVLDYPPDQNQSQAKLSDIARDLAASLIQDFPVIDAQTAETIAWSAVADWLMRCPLDFRGSNE